MKHTLTLSMLISTCLFTASASANWLDNLAGTQAKTEKTATSTVTESNELVSNVMSQLGLSQTQDRKSVV